MRAVFRQIKEQTCQYPGILHFRFERICSCLLLSGCPVRGPSSLGMTVQALRLAHPTTGPRAVAPSVRNCLIAVHAIVDVKAVMDWLQQLQFKFLS